MPTFRESVRPEKMDRLALQVHREYAVKRDATGKTRQQLARLVREGRKDCPASMASTEDLE
jgi:hypothetical protein